MNILRWFGLGGLGLFTMLTPAHATDEIQVYNAGIANVGQFTIQQHLNYTPMGVKTPAFPGALVNNGALNGTPEFAYGLTDWWEVGLYLPFAIKDQIFYSDAGGERAALEALNPMAHTSTRLQQP